MSHVDPSSMDDNNSPGNDESQNNGEGDQEQNNDENFKILPIESNEVHHDFITDENITENQAATVNHMTEKQKLDDSQLQKVLQNEEDGVDNGKLFGSKFCEYKLYNSNLSLKLCLIEDEGDQENKTDKTRSNAHSPGGQSIDERAGLDSKSTSKT